MRIAAAALLLSLSVTPALAEKLVALESKFGVKETLDRLAAELDKRGMKVAARIDHGGRIGVRTSGSSGRDPRARPSAPAPSAVVPKSHRASSDVQSGSPA